MSRRIRPRRHHRGPELHDGRRSDFASPATAAKSTTVKVVIDDDGCPAKLSTKAGPTTFKVSNEGSGDVSEFEVLSGDRIIGEVENIAPGLNGEFSLTLKAGDYTTACPGGSKHAKGKLVGHRHRRHQAQRAAEGGRRDRTAPTSSTRARSSSPRRRRSPTRSTAATSSRQAALPGGADPVRADRAGCRDVRRSRPRHRRPRG